jgi:hypothetical protein
MYRYTVVERVFIVRTYWKRLDKVMSTAIPGEVRRWTSAEQVLHLGLVEETGNQEILLDELTGGPKMSEETIQIVKDRLPASPKKSLRQLSQESGLSRSTCQRAAKNAKLHACRISVVHELKSLTK